MKRLAIVIATTVFLLGTVMITTQTNVMAQINMPNPVAIVGQSAYTDDIGDFHIVGEVQNTSNETIKSVQLVVSIYDSTHTIIGTASGYTDIDVLRPGERSAFSLSPSSIASNTPISYYQFSTSWQPATGQEKPAFLSLAIGRMYLDGSTYHVVGQVTNYGDRSANSIKVSGAFYGYNNRVMGEGIAYVNPDSLPPGQTAPFDISIFDSVPNQLIASASYNTKSDEYSMINNALPKIPSTQLDQPAVITVRPQQASLSANTMNINQQSFGAIIPVEFNPFSSGMVFSNLTLYMNSADGHYHLSGSAKNTLPETRSWYNGVTISFEDRATGTTINSVSGTINGPINPGAAVPFDIDTGYNTTQAHQFQYMKTLLTY